MTTNKNWFQEVVNANPVVVKGFVTTVIGVLGAFGVVFTDGATQAVIAFVMAVLSLLSALWGRPSVTPNAKVIAYLPDPSDPSVVKSGPATVSTTAVSDVAAAATTKAA